MTDEPTELVGTVVGDSAFARASLRIGEATHRRTTGETVLVLQLADGAIVTVAADPRHVALKATDTHRERWGELRAHPLASLFDDVAPGDHVDVMLEGWRVSPGQRVAVRGTRVASQLD
nr:hypothetical protein [Deltaproteobacteria bacterium]